MRYAALLLGLLSLIAHADPARVQTSSRCDFPQGGAGNTCVLTLNSVVSGNSIVVKVLGGEVLPGGGATAPCDDGSAYTSAIWKEVYSGAGNIYVFGQILHRHNVAAGTHTITCTNSAGTFQSYGYAYATEVSGLENAAADATASNSGTSNSPTTGSATPTTASSIAFSTISLIDFGNPVAFGHPPSGYSSVGVITDGTAAGGYSADYKILSSTAAENPSYATFTAANAWAGTIAIYKAAVTGSVPGIRGSRVGSPQVIR